jgi:hypothetical protein
VALTERATDDDKPRRLSFGTRASDSSWISTVWTCTSEGVTAMTAVASETWGPTPAADDAELLVERLVRHGVLVRDPVVTAVLRGDRPTVSGRTVERRFRAATGLTRGAVAQIERVRTAAGMLAAAAPVGDVVAKLGYYDEPHLARMLRRYVGRSAQQLRAGTGGALALDPAQFTTS